MKIDTVTIHPAYGDSRKRREHASGMVDSYEAKMEYDKKEKLFFIRIPQLQLTFLPTNKETKSWMTRIDPKVGGFVMAIASTLEKETLRRMQIFYAEYLHADHKTRKVILYRVKYGAGEIYSKLAEKSYFGDGLKHGERPPSEYGENYVLEVEYWVVDELTVGERETFVREGTGGKMEEMRDFSPRAYSPNGAVMAWTAEREEFFCNFRSNMKSMIGAIDGMLMSADTLEARIDAGTANLLTTENNHG